jgi:hypothetical protein
MKEIEEAYDAIVSRVRSTRWGVSTNTATDGHWRKVEIGVRQPSWARVSRRAGYFAPYRTN